MDGSDPRDAGGAGAGETPGGIQLALAFASQPALDFAEYLAGPNAEAVAALQVWARRGTGPTADRFLALCGPPGTGKTHLLQAACRAALEADMTAAYLPLDHPGLDPSVLDGLEGLDRIALDALEVIAGQPAWEHALFALFNRLRELGRGLLIAVRRPPAELGFLLPDLASRLTWGPTYGLRPLDEMGCADLLRQGARRRGLPLGEEAIAYLLKRCPREPGFLLALLKDLDQASLSHRRRPTLPLIRELLRARES